MKNIIAIDVDDTVLDLMSTWLSIYNEDYNDNLTRDKITDWNISQFVKPEAQEAIYDYIVFPDVFYGSAPIPNALEGVNLLKSLDYRIIYVTANNPEGCKYSWLLEKGFIDNHEDFVHALDKSLICCDYMIDDNYDNIINTWGYGILFSQPWNLQYDYHPRANNWKDLIEEIQNGELFL